MHSRFAGATLVRVHGGGLAKPEQGGAAAAAPGSAPDVSPRSGVKIAAAEHCRGAAGAPMRAPPPSARRLLLARLLLLIPTSRAAVPDFKRHPLAYRSQGAPADIWAPSGSKPGSPGFAAIRGFSMDGCDDKYAGPGSGPCGPAACARPGANCSAPIPAWTKMIDQMFNATDDGGLDLANCVWPGYTAVFSEYFPDLARVLVARHAPAVDLGGFVPGGQQDFDVHAGVPRKAFLQEGSKRAS